MNPGIAWIKSHKGLAIGIAVAVFMVTYLLSKAKGGAAAQASQSQYGLSQTDLEYLQLQAGSQNQANQLNAQLQVATLGAQVQNNQVNQSAAVAAAQVAAQLAAI